MPIYIPKNQMHRADEFTRETNAAIDRAVKESLDAERCPNDTDGDGDCHLCARKGGCPLRGGSAPVSFSVDLNPEATAAGLIANCPTCGARVATIFEHLDGCPEEIKQ